ncbi:UNVERIFIED_CONTAM: hypothetical protein H355_014099 [Colinus virginianus]|nr:hypothetical protein H355_014099 [Colinus virginianus]
MARLLAVLVLLRAARPLPTPTPAPDDVLLSCLVAVGGIAAWGKSKAKSRSDIFSLEYASREQLVPDKSQADLLS